MRKFNLKYLLLAGLGLSLFLLISKFTALPTVLGSLHLSKEPETYTELYFSDHQSVLQSFEEGFVEFTIHNLEHEKVVYDYELLAVIDEKEEVLGSDQLTLQHDELTNITEKFTAPESEGRVKISVNLKDKNQEIHFWIN